MNRSRLPNDPTMRWLLAVTPLLGLTMLTAPNASAATVATRPEVLSILGATAQTEDFQRFQTQPGTVYGLGRRLDSTTVVHRQGPDLVRPGIAFTAIDVGDGGNLQWNGPGANGQPSNAVQTVAICHLLVDFSAPTRAFGADLSSTVNGTTTCAIDVYAPDDTTLLATIDDVPLTWHSVTFVGYESPGGIGSLRMRPLTTYYIPLDNLSFNAVPEPACAPAVAFAAALLLRRRRRSTGRIERSRESDRI